MGLLEYDFIEMATRLQHGLDRLTANYLTDHQAQVLRDLLDFHGREHLEFEVEQGGHHLRVRQVGVQRGIGEPGEPTPDDFESLFDDRPSTEVPPEELAAWLAALPAG